jgi:GNAT superfamily N-acetyltransferase
MQAASYPGDPNDRDGALMGILPTAQAAEAKSGACSPVYLSAIDEERFGFRTARALDLTAHALPAVLEDCRAHGVRLLIARCNASEIRAAQAMERAGFALMDTLVFYARALIGLPPPADRGGVEIRLIRPGEEESVQAIAAQSFRGYAGHYHADDRIDRTTVEEIYPSWALRSCVSRDVADDVLVAELNGVLAGFATLRLNSPAEGEGVLFAVAPSAQGRGIYRSFMVHGMEWCRARDAQRMVVSTQIVNAAVQKVWTRLGFEFSYASYTFHKWFDGMLGRA